MFSGENAIREIGRVAGFDTAAHVTLPIRSPGELVDYAYGLDSFDLPYGTCRDGTLDAVVERAVAILTDRARDRIRRGLYRRYVEKVEDLFFVRDLVGATDGIARFARQDPYLRCSYRSEQGGLEDNLVLLWALFMASRAGIGDDRLKRKADTAWRTFAGRMPMTEATAAVALQRIYGRLAGDARPMHGLCRLVLEHAHRRPCATGLVPDGTALHAAVIARWARSAFHRFGTVRPRFDVKVDAGFRVRADTVVFVDRGGEGEPLAILPSGGSAVSTHEHLPQVEDRAREWNVPAVLLVAPATSIWPPRPAPDGTMVQLSLFTSGAEHTETGAALLRDIGYDAAAIPIHRGGDTRATIGTGE